MGWLPADPLILTLGLAVIALSAALALLVPALIGQRPQHRRLASVVGHRTLGTTERGEAQSDRARRRKIDETLKEMAVKQQATARAHASADLDTKMRQGGLRWSRGYYIGICLGCGGAILALCLLAFDLRLLPSLGFAAGGGALLPYTYVNRARTKRFNTFLAEFPDALDVITRGVRSGLPLNDCLHGIADEGRPPLKGEFRQLVDDMAIGIPLDEALTRLVGRVPLLEVKLFGIILEIQNHAGGNLAEAIGNLARVLRDRKRMAGKIKALSSEATASAGIVGSLPLIVLALLFFVAPDYIGVLFTAQLGQLVLAAGGIWMLLGIFVMRSMIRIEV